MLFLCRGQETREHIYYNWFYRYLFRIDLLVCDRNWPYWVYLLNTPAPLTTTNCIDYAVTKSKRSQFYLPMRSEIPVNIIKTVIKWKMKGLRIPQIIKNTLYLVFFSEYSHKSCWFVTGSHMNDYCVPRGNVQVVCWSASKSLQVRKKESFH